MKNFTQIVLWSLSLSLLLCLNVTSGATVPRQSDVLGGLVHERTKIKRGCFEIVSTVSTVGFADVTWTWTIWLDGDKCRADVRRNGAKDVICEGCYGKNTRLFYTDRTPPDKDGKMALSFYDGDSAPSPFETVSSPLWVGVHPCAFESLYVFQPASLLDIGKRVASLANPVTEVVVEGKPPCWLVSIAIPEGSNDGESFLYFVDQSDSSRIYRSEYRIGKNGEILTDVIDTLEHYGKECFFLPKKLKYVRKEQGKITSKAEISVNAISVNDQLSPEIFSLKGIDILQPDTPVEWSLTRDRPFPEGRMVWDGKDIVLEDRLAAALKDSGRFFWFRLACVLIGLALICWGLALKSRKKD